MGERLGEEACLVEISKFSTAGCPRRPCSRTMIFVSLSELTNRCAEQWRNFSWRRVKALRRSADFNSLKRTDSEPITLKWVQCNHKGTSVQAGRVSVRVM